MNLRARILNELVFIDGGKPLEESLGPNYKLLLNFWSYYDSLSGFQKAEANRRRRHNIRRFDYWLVLEEICVYHGGTIARITENEDVTLQTTSFEIYLIDKILLRGIEPLYIKLFENL
jgi:hypothetical protein